MFIPCSEKSGSAYYEFQYCKKKLPLKRLLNANSFWQPDSLLVHIDDDEVFMENYLKYLCVTNAPDGSDRFCYFGINYYTKQQTAAILEAITADRPKEFEIIIPWLKRAAEEYNGFYFLGI